VAVEYFLKIDGISGESSDEQHKGEIELESWSWGVSQSGVPLVGTGGGTGKADVQDLVVTMPASKAAPKLMLSCVSGEHHKEAILTVRKAGKGQPEFLSVTMTDLIITSYQTAGSVQSDVISDQASLAFSTIRMEFRPQKEDGTLDTPVVTGWDVKNNKAI
jgi:type VI secretion system secreted protein Hcp